ncbi:hypothetical protein GCK72_011650 [Caenorhabditis remanei]|uniref:Peptidase S1 domain-containing protein n=1 Tax=Caenorhabditis remanei TaxID=31234 RepID=A0A6A5H994_CAERE|nr:hypothetical protein GCK72_011650 [Caenorhabditis remanei]KAF1763384.1 hypothetical protein GCK72_011650 [Caenorhabditis remanei]
MKVSLIFSICVVILAQAKNPAFKKLTKQENEKRLVECGSPGGSSPKDSWIGRLVIDGKVYDEYLGVLISSRHVVFSKNHLQEMGPDSMASCNFAMTPWSKSRVVEFPNDVTGVISDKVFFFGSCSPLSGIIVVELEKDLERVPICFADRETYKGQSDSFIKFKIVEEMSRSISGRDGIVEVGEEMAECTQGKRTEYCMKDDFIQKMDREGPQPAYPIDVHPIFGGAISNPITILQNYKETAFGLTIEYVKYEKLIIHGFKEHLEEVCQWVGICAEGDYKTAQSESKNLNQIEEKPSAAALEASGNSMKEAGIIWIFVIILMYYV